MEYICYCRTLNKENPEVKYEQLYYENLHEQKSILNRFEQNMKILVKNMKNPAM